jgi:hypothetical protein
MPYFLAGLEVQYKRFWQQFTVIKTWAGGNIMVLSRL